MLAGDVSPRLSPFVMKSQACMPEKSPCGRNYPGWSTALPAPLCGRRVFGCRYLPSNLHSITEAGRTGRIFLLVFSQQKPTCPNYNLGSISLVGSEVSKTFAGGVGMQAGGMKVGEQLIWSPSSLAHGNLPQACPLPWHLSREEIGFWKLPTRHITSTIHHTPSEI